MYTSIASLDTKIALRHFGYEPASSVGGRTLYRCPLHPEGEGHSFQVFDTPEAGWHCFGRCQTGGNAVRFIALHERLPYPTAVRLAEQIYGVKIQFDRRKVDLAELYQVNREFALRWHRNLLERPDLLAYLDRERGIPLKTVKAWQLGYAKGQADLPADPGRYPTLLKAGILSAPTGDRYMPAFIDRLVIPIRDADGDIPGFSGRQNPRTLQPPERAARIPKWKNTANTPIFEKSAVVLGLRPELDKQIQDFGGIVLVEGGFDAVVLQRQKIPAAAVMGLALGRGWLESLTQRTRRIILFLDGDEAGREGTIRLAQRVLLPTIERRPDISIQVAFPPSGLDPDDFLRRDEAGCRQALNNAVPILDYVCQTMVSGALAFQSFADRRVFLFEKYQEVLAAFPAATAWKYWTLIEEETGVDVARSFCGPVG